ncbi:MAG: sugar phosphate isomerase/epimerase [Lachnospiraceae bacterium]|jgi:sugar phosphate isomerase/epimerase|nr:sugar phosphate isomerase/epimerase [Lachnospiraceae bacterium]
MHDIKIGTLISAGNVKKIMPQLIRHGFETFSITFWGTAGDWDMAELAASVKAILAGTDCQISCLSFYGNPLIDGERGEAARDGWSKLIETAHLFNTDLVTGFTGRLIGESVPDSIPRFAEVFTPFAEKARDKGLRLAFENCDMGGNWKSGDWNIAFTPKAWEMMFAAVPFDNIGLQWEPCHQIVQFTDPMAQLRKWADKVFSLHGKDATVAWDVIKEQGISGVADYVWHRTPGFGDTNWTDIITILRMAGFKGSIDIEGWHDPVYRDELEYTGQVHALNYLKQCRGGEIIPNFEKM